MSTPLKFNQPESDMESSRGLARPNELVVQCPACLTGFGIERSVVAAVLAPRFHCSKCDHTFGLEENAINRGQRRSTYAAPELSSVPRPPTPITTTSPALAPSAFDPEIAEGVVAVYRNKSKIDPTMIDPTMIDPTIDSPVDSPLGHLPYQPKEQSPRLDIPKRWDGSMRANEPRESAPALPTALSHHDDLSHRSALPTRQLGLNLHGAQSARHEARRIGVAHSIRSDSTSADSPELINIESFGTVQNTPLRDAPLHDSAEAMGGAFGGNIAYAAAFSEPSAATTHPLVNTPLDDTAGNQKSARRQPLSPVRSARPGSFAKAIATPVVGAFILLLGISTLLTNNRSVSERFLQSAVPGALQAAPRELYIKNSRFQKVTLDNGEVVRIVSGTIANSGQSNFYGIQLEAVAFNRFGKPLGTVRADASSVLAKSKVQSLTTEMIQQLQKGSSTKQLIIKPGQQREFAVALIGDEYAPAQHFGARVFAAKSF